MFVKAGRRVLDFVVGFCFWFAVAFCLLIVIGLFA